MKPTVVILLAVYVSVHGLIAAEGAGGASAPVTSKAATEDRKPELPKFDLDFRGGTPGQLVEAINKASGHPLNAIILKEDEDAVLPPLKLRHTNVVQLFDAMVHAHAPMIMGPDGAWHTSPYNSWCGFSSAGGPVDQDTVWYFYKQGPPALPKRCRFYQLGPYLNNNSVDSITTAINTGWKMLGNANLPTMSFHKDTGLLIAVGDPNQLQVIDEVLQNLPREDPKAMPPKPGSRAQ
jgi:hypothetical protein